MKKLATFSVAAFTAAAISLALNAQSSGASEPVVAGQTPPDLVNALHTAFGEHHARAVHTKGVMFEGVFTPDPAARAITSAPIFSGGALPVMARFSLFAGIPDIPDTAGPAQPTGLALKIKAADGTDYDLASDQHNGFIVATSDEFAAFLRAVGASGANVPHPTPVEQFLSTRPISQHFLATLTSPASYATAAYFGINSFKWTNAQGKSVFVRYQYVPRAGEHYLKPEELKTKTPNYLQDEIVDRIARGPVIFDWYAQIAEPGDKIEDPSIAWPDTRRRVKLGTFTMTRRPADIASADKQTFYLVGQPHPGIEAADPMLILRNTAYPISFGQRQ
ncbi:catalase family peroxidase [Sphingomonas sp. PR090111-T3T-6A]|uniref:catalase family peroxidase n=1 Tax=Sphingomonas sp. PR090111-T3T-6A TaxID=685778 RepID=UPI0003AAF8E1|nr:catalase family peroxidase [Sphingomonas sp. PR090111-T3T-6A]